MLSLDMDLGLSTDWCVVLMEMLFSVRTINLQSVHFLTILYLTVLPNIRDGLLLHTGNWTTDEEVWTPEDAMPNSSGCIHSHPSSIELIYNTLTNLGVEVRENPYSGKNYPYDPQGIAVIELIA